MAIIKEKTLASGAVGDYWRILDIHIDRQSRKVNARIALFKDQAHSTAGAPPIGGIKSFFYSFTMSELLAQDNLITWVYTKIMAIAETEVTKDITGATLAEPMPFDSDIAGGTVS